MRSKTRNSRVTHGSNIEKSGKCSVTGSVHAIFFLSASMATSVAVKDLETEPI